MRLPRLDLPATVTIAAAICGLVGYPLTDYDYFWHLRTGQLILETGTIPTAEPFSFSAEGRPWLVQGGLFAAALAWFHGHFGDLGVRGFFTALVLATCAVVFRTVRLHVDDPSRALAITLVSTMGAAPYFVARPLIVTLLGFAVTHFLLTKHRLTGQAWWLLGIPPLMTVWINAHFGYVLGLGLIGLFFAANLLSRLMPIDGSHQARGRIGLTHLLALMLASLLALGLNPAGYSAVLGAVDMTVTNAAAQVVEWHSPDFHLRSGQIFLLMLAIVWTARLLARTRPDWLDILLLLSMSGAALYAMRHMPVASIALAPVAASAFAGWRPLPWRNRWLEAIPQRLLSAGARDMGDRASQLNLLLIGGLALLVLLARPSIAAWHDASLRKQVPVAAADFMESKQLQGRVFNAYAAGGYLIWRLYPSSRVFVDGRYNPFAPDLIAEYMATIALREGWLDTLERHEIDSVLAHGPDSGLAQALVISGRYRLVYADPYFGVLIPNDGSRPDLPTVKAPESKSRLE